MSVRRPKTKTKRCAHCKRRRPRLKIEWHPGIDEWQCSDFAQCDDAVERARPSRKLSGPALSPKEVSAVRRYVKEQRESWGGDPDVDLVTALLDRLLAARKL